MVCGAFLAIWMGMSIVTAQSQTILKVVAAAFTLICLLLGQRIWLLLIFMMAMDVVIFRGFTSSELGQAAFLGFALMLFAIRKLKFQFRFGELEFWVLMLTCCCVQTYLRNPVGLNLLGGSSVGGTPYLVVAASITSAFLLSTFIVNPKELKWAMRLGIIGGLVGIPGNILRYGSVSMGNEDLSRIPALSKLSMILSRTLISFVSPIRACFHPFWGFILLLAIATAAGSGYRNSIAQIGFYLLVGIAYRSGLAGMLASLLLGSFGLVLLAIVNLNFPLPGNIQRALSPFPGTWEKQYTQDADDSTEWRVEMWKEALTSDRWIRNKILGDGVGMSAAQLNQNENIAATRTGIASSGLLIQQENMLINGSYHSGPVHTIRAVGYVGLAVLLLTMIRVAVHAHRQIMRCRGTEWHPVALFFCIPQIINPLFFTFIFGEYDTGVTYVVLGIAMVRLLERNLPLPTVTRALRAPYMLNKTEI